KRDQISLPYVLKNQNKNIAALDSYGIDLRFSENHNYFKHKALKSKSFNQEPLFLTKNVIQLQFPVTIIVCVYNALEDVTKCLNALIKGIRQIDTIIIIDDYSDDKTKSF